MPGERVGAGGLRPAPANDRGEVATSFHCASEVGRRGVGDFTARELHVDAIRADLRVALEVGVNDDVFDRIDVDVRAGVGRQSRDREVVFPDDEVDRGASGAGGDTEGRRPDLRVGSEDEGVGDDVGGLVGVSGIGACDGIVSPRLVACEDMKLGLHRRRRDARLRHFRGLHELDVGDRAGGAENARRSRGRCAEESLRHHHGRTFIE